MTLQKNSITNLTDEQLVAQYKANPDSRLFGEVYNRYYQKVYFTCMGLVKDRGLAYDMVQDVMIKAMENLPRLENDFLLGLWIHRIAKNHCLDYLKQRKTQHTMDIDETEEIGIEDTDMEAILEKEETFSKMEKAIEYLSVEEQELIRLKYNEGYSVQDLQDKYHLNKSAVKMRLARTRQKLAAMML